MAEKTASFEGYSYRTSARFGSRVWVTVNGGEVTVTGPRVPVPLYRLWVGVQAVLLALVAAALAGAVIRWDWRYLVAALAFLAAHAAAGGFGAGCLWEMMNLIAFGAGTRGDTMVFPLSAVKRVMIGRGWARHGMWLLILPYVGGIDSMAKGICVSFEAPDGATGHDAVYALHMRTPADAQALAAALRSE